MAFSKEKEIENRKYYKNDFHTHILRVSISDERKKKNIVKGGGRQSMDLNNFGVEKR